VFWCSYDFLIYIIKKYGLVRLLNVVKTREDRCSLERIFAVIFFLELRKYKTILGNIFDYNFGGTYEKYIQDKKNNKIEKPVIKVFTGR
jgi:tetrahydromethanopterin S-methyltransferase subunit D